MIFYKTCALLSCCWLLRVALGADNATSNSTNDNSVCKRVQNNLSGKQILLAAKLRSPTLLVITEDWFVWELPLTSLNQTIDKLYLGDTKPKPMSEKWPSLYQSSQFAGWKQHGLDVFFMFDNIGDYLEFETDKQWEDYAFRYNIDNGQFGWGYHYQSDDVLRLIPSGQYCSYYQLTILKDKMTIMKFVCTGPDVQNAGNIASEHSPFYHICESGSDSITIVKDPNAPCKHIQWPIVSGFTANGKLYLFGSTYIISFKEEAYNKPGTPVELRKVPFSDFIQCGGNVNAPRDIAVSKKPPSLIGLIVAIVLTVLILLLCCLLCLMREAMARRKKKKKGSKDNGGGPTSWLPFNKGRSTGLPSFGTLSKPRSKGGRSSRSTGLPPVGALSKKQTPKKSSSNKTSNPRAENGTGVSGQMPNSKPSGNPTQRSSAKLASKKMSSKQRASSKQPASSSNKGRKGSKSAGPSCNTSQRTGRSNNATERSKLKNSRR